ncbi:type IV secretion protein Rhs [Mixta theicola]|uniref:Type IV secretion protein Rhs n=1 Tax=Mixta theicola TaxID=1458355 RepID=A0A2K1QA20_9GAMM|nr:polymorphic toxin type 46 domain-containing protein [Mixta theicola]PNS11876.1 type IV secretion protein Rhs [Mixta theicola]GLR07806.1 hypothetical protein GCM10007905_05250 [Mixta theicola]
MSGDNAFAAAREGDNIAHVAAKGWLVLGLIGGAIVGAACTLVTGGVGTAVLAATVAGAASGGGLGELLGGMSWAPRHVTGQLTMGSANVFINGRPAIIAPLSAGKCAEHGPGAQPVAEGSSRVYINGYPAARIGDRLACGGMISQGSSNVYIGGAAIQVAPINPDIPAWVNATLFGVGLAATAVIAGPMAALMATAGAMAGGYAGDFIGGEIYGQGSDGQKWLSLGGAFAGGVTGIKGGIKTGDNHPVRTQAHTERRARLNEKFGRTGDINRDINIRGNRELVRNFMQKSGMKNERIINDYMKGINMVDKVSVEAINRGKLAYQNQAPGNWQGNWYSMNETTPPTKLGINPSGNLHDTEIKVPKVITTYKAQRPLEMLRSKASPVLDTWSVPQEPFQTEGGGIQWFSTNKGAWEKIK